jgi:signal transduction histidine kinase
VKLNFAERIVNLSVTDDGLGFNADQPPSRPGRFGLVGLRERAAQLGGALQIGSKPGRGTEINLAVPVAS